MKKNLLLFLTFCSVFFWPACKKESPASQFTLAPLKIVGNKITLSWTKVTSEKLISYTICKVTDSNDVHAITKVSVSSTSNEFRDSLSFVPYVQYYVIAEMPDAPYLTSLTSNKQTVTRENIISVPIEPTEALYDKGTQMIYMYNSDGDIATYDLQNKKTMAKISTNATIGYCDFGTYNGKTELYVPRADGWLFIYDANSLQQIDQINVGSIVSSVACSNGQLLLCGYFHTNTITSSSIFVYNRATKTKVSAVDGSNFQRISRVPDSALECFAVTSSAIGHFKFNGSGACISQQVISASGFYLSALPFAVSPNGNYIISQYYGSIVNSSLSYVSTLPYGNNKFTSFDFDVANNLVYAACEAKQILGYSMSNYVLAKTINTQGYPLKIFVDNGKVICISKSQQYTYTGDPVRYFIEQY